MIWSKFRSLILFFEGLGPQTPFFGLRGCSGSGDGFKVMPKDAPCRDEDAGSFGLT